MDKKLEKLSKKELIELLSKMSKKNIIKILLNNNNYKSGGKNDIQLNSNSEIVTQPILFNPIALQNLNKNKNKNNNNIMRNNKIYEAVTDY